MKILVAIASYGNKNDHYLKRVIEEYRAMPYAVHIVVFSNEGKALGDDIEVKVGLPSPDPWSLPFAHKRIFCEKQDEYDLFIYSEDDVLITKRNLDAFLRIEQELEPNEIAGFFRFEERDGLRSYPEVHGHFHWDPSSVCRRGEYQFAFFTNEHAACYVLTKEQLKRSVRSGGYLVAPHCGRYDLACSAATDPYTQCGFKKLICISHIEDFLVHHLPNRYFDTEFGIKEDEFNRQICALVAIAKGESDSRTLFTTETTLSSSAFSKDYYERPNELIQKIIPSYAKRVLSVGCGWGFAEVLLSQSGLKVTAVPIDSVIPGGAEAAGVEMVYGSLEAALLKLAHREFDCFLFANVLHLLQHPIEVVRSFSKLRAPRSSIVIISPNMRRLAYRMGQISCQNIQKKKYRKWGREVSSPGQVKTWAGKADATVTQLEYMLSRRAKQLSKLTLGLTDSMLCSEIVCVAEWNG